MKYLHLAFLFIINGVCGDFLHDKFDVPYIIGFNQDGSPIKWRPQWDPNVEAGFRIAHNTARGVPNPAAAGNIQNAPDNSNLCHTFPWNRIRNSLSVSLQQYWRATTGTEQPRKRVKPNKERTEPRVHIPALIDLLFLVDDEAFVNLAYADPDRQTRVKFTNYLRNGMLTALNMQLRTNALAVFNQLLNTIDGIDEEDRTMNRYPRNVLEQQTRQLLSILNSAPANLRYGHAITNRILSDHLDPMGNRDYKITRKEIRYGNYFFLSDGATRNDRYFFRRLCPEPLRTIGTTYCYGSSNGVVNFNPDNPQNGVRGIEADVF